MPDQMYARYLRTAGIAPAHPGDLVLVEVPANCTVHSADAARLARLRALAAEMKRVFAEPRSFQLYMIYKFAQEIAQCADPGENEDAR